VSSGGTAGTFVAVLPLMLRTLAASLVVLVGCSSASEDPAPTLEVTTPARGTFASGDTVMVTGRVIDNGPVRLTVAGTEVTPAADGTFSTTITVGEGIAVIETHAIDGAGHDVRDVRAVLAGTLAPTDGASKGEVGARAGVTALRAVGGAIATSVKGINFDAAAKSANPIYNNDGCLGAVVNITSVTVGNIGVGLVPKTGILATDVTIENIVVKASAKWRVACFGSTATVTLKASKAKIHGDLAARVASGKIATSLPGASVSFEGFSFDIGGVPSQLESLVKGKVSDYVEGMLAGQIKSKVPPIADKAIAGLVAQPVNTSLLNRNMKITMAPSNVKITNEELFVSLDTTVLVTGGEGGTFLTTAPTLATTTMEVPKGIGVALDDDIINQLFAGLWSADALEPTIAVDSIPALGALLDDNARVMSITMSLPPTVSTETGELVLSIGDMMINVLDENGADVHQIAVSLKTTIAAEPSQAGKILLTVGAPTVYAQVLLNSEAVEEPLTGEHVEAIVTGAWGLVGSKADDALSKIPMPTIAGIQLGAPTVEAANGFVVADIPVM
jgi:hypothetical protein